MLDLWNLLKGKKTYLLALTCIGMVLLKASSESLHGTAVDWEQVMHQVLTCLMTMALRHSIGNGNGVQAKPAVDARQYDLFDR